jgi:hypothetical protein
MGMYCEIVGTVTFKKKEEFEAFFKRMIEGGWYDGEKDCWIAEGGEEVSDCDAVDDENLTVDFPQWNMRNIHRLVNELEKMDWEGELRGVTDDGYFEGWITRPKQKDYTVDLESWAKEYGFELTRDEEIGDWDTDQRCYVMESFLEDPFPPRNSEKYILED